MIRNINNKKEKIATAMVICSIILSGIALVPTAVASSSSWTVGITVTSGGEDKGDPWVFGVNVSATDGYDAAFDVDAPPADPTGFDMYFSEPGVGTGKFRKDIKAPGDKTWNVLVTAPTSTMVNLSWDPSTIPSNVNVQIQEFDTTTGEVTGTSMDMKTTTLISFSGGAFAATTKGYRITVTVEVVPEWTVGITATSGGEDKGDPWVFGVNVSATDGYDAAFDVDAPPADPTGFDMYFSEPGVGTGKFRKDIKAPGDKTWNVLVTAPTSTMVNLSWDPTIPSIVTVKIQEFDTTTGEVTGTPMDMKTTTLISFSGGAYASTTKGYRITATVGVPVVSEDTHPPLVTNPTATPASIPADGVTTTTLSVTVVDNTDPTNATGVKSVTIDLRQIGGSATTTMTPSGDVYSVTTVAAAGITPAAYNLPVTATDIADNVNTSMSIPLTVAAPAVTITFVDLTATGTKGNYVTASVTVSGTAGTYTIVVSGTGTAQGYPLAGTGVVVKGSGAITIPVLVYIPQSDADTGSYTLYAGLYEGTTITAYPKMVSGPEVTSVT